MSGARMRVKVNMKPTDTPHRLILEWQQALQLARGTLIAQASTCTYRRGWFYQRVADRLRDGQGLDGNGTVIPGAALPPVRALALIGMINRFQDEAATRWAQATTNAAAVFIYKDAVRACYGEDVLQRSIVEVTRGGWITIALEVDGDDTAMRLKHRRIAVLDMARRLYRRSWKQVERA